MPITEAQKRAIMKVLFENKIKTLKHDIQELRDKVKINEIIFDELGVKT